MFLWRNKKNYSRIITKYSSLTSPLSMARSCGVPVFRVNIVWYTILSKLSPLLDFVLVYKRLSVTVWSDIVLTLTYMEQKAAADFLISNNSLTFPKGLFRQDSEIIMVVEKMCGVKSICQPLRLG